MIQVVPYQSDWPQKFQSEAARLKQMLKENASDLHHIGSTSIPGLCAKPILDILLVIPEGGQYEEELKSLDYQARGELNIPFRFFFKKRTEALSVNLHVYEEGDPEIEMHLLFRAILIERPDLLSEYQRLKQSLVEDMEMHRKKEALFHGYNLGKDRLIKKILRAAGFQEPCMRICTHHDEWVAAGELAKKGEGKEPGVPLIFYKGPEIIGYAELDPVTGKFPLFRLPPDCPDREYFRDRCRRWARLRYRAKNES